MKVPSSKLLRKAYCDLLEEGDGSWPPKPTFEDTWPVPLKPYADLCDKAREQFTVPVMEDRCNIEQTLDFTGGCPFATSNVTTKAVSVTRPCDTTNAKAVGNSNHGDCPLHPSTSQGTPSTNKGLRPTLTRMVSERPSSNNKSRPTLTRMISERLSANKGSRPTLTRMTSERALSFRVKTAKINDAETEKRREQKVESMRTFLCAECENLPPLDIIMEAVDSMDAMGRSGFLGCLTFILHMYRWGICPVIKYAQLETSMPFPERLWVPFKHISEVMGLALAGSVYTTNFCNAMYDDKGEFVRFRFKFTSSAFPEILETEIGFMRCVLEVDRAAGTLLPAMVECFESFDAMDNESAVACMKSAQSSAINVYKAFSERLQDVDPEYWLRYYQGPAAWGIDGVGGTSGAQGLAIQAMDAFLQLKGSSSVYNFMIDTRDHMTTGMRSFLEALTTCGMADVLNQGHFASELYEEYNHCVRRLHGFRIVHKYKSIPFYRERSERKPMLSAGGLIPDATLGMSETDGKEQKDKAIKDFLRARLSERLVETVSAVPCKCPLNHVSLADRLKYLFGSFKISWKQHAAIIWCLLSIVCYSTSIVCYSTARRKSTPNE